MSRASVVLCGVPNEFCSGGILNTDQALPKKCHASSQGAFKCMTRYLVKIKGYTRLGAREFSPPEGSNATEVLMLSKRMRYGTRLRQGKGGVKSRFMPKRGSGVIFETSFETSLETDK